MYKIYYTDCGTDYSIQNGFANFTDRSTNFKEMVPVTCMDGYELHGDEHITCLEDGEWSGNVTCRIRSMFHPFINRHLYNPNQRCMEYLVNHLRKPRVLTGLTERSGVSTLGLRRCSLICKVNTDVDGTRNYTMVCLLTPHVQTIKPRHRYNVLHALAVRRLPHVNNQKIWSLQ